jgi:cytochrome c oxidase subunit 2
MFGNKIRARLACLTGAFATAVTPSVWAGFDELNMPVGVTPLSRSAYDIHMLMLYICIIIGILVFGAMAWSIVHHRKSKGHEAAQFHHSTFAEIVWTVIPFIILVAFAVPATKGLIAMEDTSDADVTVKITGYQWKWKYEYIEDDVTVYSNLALSSRAAIFDNPEDVPNYLLEVDNEIVLPTHKKIRFVLTSEDVIHAWWVPAFGMKKDAVPGFVNELWARIEEPGTYRGQCAELCGKDHGFMPIVVIAKAESEYNEWLAERQAEAAAQAVAINKQWDKQELISEGQAVYDTNCAVCHQPDGTGAGSFPAIKGSSVVTGPLDDHLNLVLNGKPGTAMAAFESRLNDAELAAVVTYQRNAFGNEVGDVVQPSLVRTARNL